MIALIKRGTKCVFKLLMVSRTNKSFPFVFSSMKLFRFAQDFLFRLWSHDVFRCFPSSFHFSFWSHHFFLLLFAVLWCGTVAPRTASLPSSTDNYSSIKPLADCQTLFFTLHPTAFNIISLTLKFFWSLFPTNTSLPFFFLASVD